MAHHKETEIPDLRIVPAESIILHEEVDERRVMPLVNRLREDKLLKNPPIVAPLPTTNRFVVLDGANRTTALWRMEVPHHLVQVVDYEEVALDTWGHLIVGLTEKEFESRRMETGLSLWQTEWEIARADLLARRISAILCPPDGTVYALGRGGSLGVEAADLRKLVSIYSGRSAIHRVKTETLADLLPYYDHVTCLIRFPRYTPADIITLSSDGDKLPTGITRHVIPRRALRVNLPFSLLEERERNTAEKQLWLKEWIKEKLAHRQVRYYQESTFLFDE